MAGGARLFSIGHSSHSLARLVQLLREADVTAVADVRSHPYSQRHPQFSRPDLEDGLREADLAYAFLGDLLGGRPAQPSLYDPAGRVDYERVRATAGFRRGLDQLVREAEQFRIALLCAEEDPLDCHRGLMIAPALAERGLYPVHLRADGSRETTAGMEDRLLRVTGVGAGLVDGLFATALTAEDRAGLLAEAYRLQARRRAFRQRPDEAAE